jgi:hypothetical protein
MRDSPFPASSSTFRTAVLPHARPVCALNAATALARRVCKRRPGLHFSPNQNPRNSIRPALPIRNPQRPSGADSNPIGRSPRPSQTPATYFKRPYRNCPGRRPCDRPPLSRRGSPDRDLTFLCTDDRGLLPIKSARTNRDCDRLFGFATVMTRPGKLSRKMLEFSTISTITFSSHCSSEASSPRS